MIRISALAATALICATAAFAQTNVPENQSLCVLGFEKAKDDGRLRNTGSDAFKAADKNNDGMLTKTEFDAACSNRLFKEHDKAN
jgi:hypothetical protein